MFRTYKLVSAHYLTQWWPWVIVFWMAVAIGLRMVAPSWNRIAQDGDFQFMPDNLPSRVGQRWLERGFPEHRARSQLIIIVAREKEKLSTADMAVPLDIARRLAHATGLASYQRWAQRQKVVQPASFVDQEPNASQKELQHVLMLLDEAIALDQHWFDLIKTFVPEGSPLLEDRLAIAYWDRAAIHLKLGNAQQSEADVQTARLITPSIEKTPEMSQRQEAHWGHLMDIWTWRDPVLGTKLGDNIPNAKLISLQLDAEFISTKNIELLNQVETLLEQAQTKHEGWIQPGLELGVSGSAAVGGDMLRAAAGSVRQTEFVTVALILIILAVVYRGPLLVAIPIATIALSLLVSTSVIALLANDPQVPGDRSGLQVFTTTRIFLVVLLFGAGTDFCLFFISRCREAFSKQPRPSRRQVQRMVAGSWYFVHDALLGSALTTIIGLGLMYFADFEKFRYTGPIIGLSLAITILVCLTFTPAVVCGLGKWAFWPTLQAAPATVSGVRRRNAEEAWIPFWERIADLIIARPILTLILGLVVLGLPAIHGWRERDHVTYDFAHELSPSSPSREGTRLVENFFNTRDGSPLTIVLATQEPMQDDKAFRAAIESVRRKLYVDGVASVRTLTDPLGDYPPDRRMSLFDQDAWRRRLLENHRMTQQLYIATNDEYARRIARIDLLLKPSPFSTEAEAVLKNVEKTLAEEVNRSDSPWQHATFACTGTTPGILDLKNVTQSDQYRIQWLVTIGVWMVLFIMLRKWFISGYLIMTVLLSYLTTLGLSFWFFQWAYGDDFVGLDWKVPLFLFVILVAVGQDYNVYLTTRIFEEQSNHGPIQGLRRAMILTGGIITSCGVIMAGTFASMTSGAVTNFLADWGFPIWLVGASQGPVLRGIVELGFALSLGVLIDTLIVRTILVPAMFAWLTRRGRFAASR